MYKITVNQDNIPKGELVEVDGLGLFPNKQEAVISREIAETFEARSGIKISEHLKGDKFTFKKMTKDEEDKMKNKSDTPVLVNPVTITEVMNAADTAGSVNPTNAGDVGGKV